MSRDYLTLEQQRKLLTSMDTGEWYTPDWYIHSVKQVMGEIDLDPASSESAQRIVQAGTYYTRKQDGLKKSWFGRVFLNPPYSEEDSRRAIAPLWTKKAIEQWTCRNVTQLWLLVNAKIGYNWFNSLVNHEESITLLHQERISFIKAEPIGTKYETSPSRQPQATIVFGIDPAKFIREFGKYGWLIM